MSRRGAANPETVADYDVRSPAIRTILTVVGTAVAVAGVAGLVLGLSLLMKDTQVSTSQVDMGANAQLVVNATSADLEIVEGEPDLLTVTSTVTSGLRKTDYQLGRRDDEIKIVSTCQTWLNPGCGVKTRLQVPPGMPLVIRTTTGQVRAEAISEGVLNVKTSTGDVTVTELGVDEFSAETTSGVVKATFAKQPFGLKAITKQGDITATLPTGKRTYQITTDSKSGRVLSKLRSDDKGQGLIRMTSNSGNVILTAVDPDEE